MPSERESCFRHSPQYYGFIKMIRAIAQSFRYCSLVDLHLSTRFTSSSVPGDPISRLLDCIDRGFDYFGESVKVAIYWILENEYKMNRRDAVLKPDAFSANLTKLFGPGAKVVEMKIVEEIQSLFGVPDSAVRDMVSSISYAKTMLREI